MADPIARLRVLGIEVVAYRRTDCDCDVEALTRDVSDACEECPSVEEILPRMKSVADRHALGVEYDTSKPVADKGSVSFWFVPRS